MKRSWGRLGAAIGAVALVSGGLLGTAAPAQAELITYETWNSTTYDVTYGSNGRDNWYVYARYQSGKYNTDNCDGAVKEFVKTYPLNGEYVTFNKERSPSYDSKSGCQYFLDYVEPVQPWGPRGIAVSCVPDEAPSYNRDEKFWECVNKTELPQCGDSEYTAFVDGRYECQPDGEPVQSAPPPPPCWDASINNCPVGGALRFTAPQYAMVGVPVTMYAYASWRPDANSPAQPTNGTAVIRVDGEDYSGVEFKDGVAQWRFIPETEGMKEFTASGVLFSGLSGANAYIDTVEARTYVLEYDPAAYAAALKKKAVEVGETYTITDPNQARSYLKDRYEWSVSEKSDDVCAVYETKKGAVKAKFNGEGKCTVIWMDSESAEEGKYTFIAKK